MLRIACSAVALLALSNPALAAGCASPSEAAALKTAVIQQELMVAALQCRETGAYNRFVIAYRSELQSSDENLKAFFARRGGEHGEAGYDTFKTKAANLSALHQARDARAFCADAHALFLAARNHQGSLMSFVEARSGLDFGNNICVESSPVLPVLSGTQIKPEKAPAFVRTADAKAPDVAVGGVPDHSLPAIPYRQKSRDSVAPPPYYQPRNRADDDAGPAFVRTADAKAPPADVAVGRVPDHSLPAIPYQQESRDSVAPPPYYEPRNRPADVAVGGVPDHSLPAIPYQQESRDNAAPSPRAVARDDDAAQREENNARGSYVTENAEEAPPPRPRYYRPRNWAYDDRDYERAYRGQAYYPPPRAGIPLSLWQQQGSRWQAWREYPRPRYGMYPRDPYRGW